MGEVISLSEFRKSANLAAATIQAAEPANDNPVPALKPTNDVTNGVVMRVDGVECFDYGSLMQRHMRNLIRDVLWEVEAHGLPQESVLLIELDTRHPGVEMPKWLRDEYPRSITIMFDKWWEDLNVDETQFVVTMNFRNTATEVTVPFEAIETFADDKRSFALAFRFEDQMPNPPSVA